MPHLPLPEAKDDYVSKPLPPLDTKSTYFHDVATTMTSSAPYTPKLNRILYVIRVKLGDTGVSGLAFLYHATQFAQDEVDKMIAEATEVVRTCRLPKHREELRGKPLNGSPQEINEFLFQSDVTFFEAVFVDRFGFEVARGNVLETTFEPVIAGVK